MYKIIIKKESIKDYIFLIFGSIISAFGTACFLLPNQISSGGFSGIATIVYYFFHVPMGNSILILNIPIFVFAYIRQGKKFVFNSMIATLLYSWFINIFEKIPPFTNDKVLASVYGGIITGIGLALIFKGKSANGGTELLASIIKTYNKNIRLGNIIQIVDFTIVFCNVIFFRKIEIGLYSAIVIYLINKMIDIVFEGINFCKMIYIISEKKDEIAKVINEEIERGATGLYGKGLYTNREKMIILCVAKRKDMIKIREISQMIDPNCFIIITDAREVYGLGFKR